MQFCVRDEVEHFEESFHPYYDAIKIDEEYFEDREGHERAAITLVKQLQERVHLYGIITFPDGGGYDVDFVYENDNAVPGITKNHFGSREELLEGWKNFLRVYK